MECLAFFQAYSMHVLTNALQERCVKPELLNGAVHKIL